MADAERLQLIARMNNAANTFSELGNLINAAGSQHKIAIVAQIAADTASAISSLMAHAEANPLNALTFGGAGMAQWISGIARIFKNASQAKKLLTGNEYYTGGFTETGDKYDAVGVVHANEYVLPEEALENPMIAQLLQNIIEPARQQGNLRQLNMPSAANNIVNRKL